MTALARWLLLRAVPGALVGAVLMLLACQFGVSLVHADPLVTAASPVAQGVSTAQSGWDVVTTYGPIWGAMVLVYGLLSEFLRRNDSEHWIAQGRMLALLVAVAGLLSSVLEAQLAGKSWSGVIVTLFGAVKLVMSPTVVPRAPDESDSGGKAAQYSHISLLIVLVMASTPLLLGGVS